MKRYSFFLALAIFVVSFGLANAQGISVDEGASSGIYPYPGTGTMTAVPGGNITFAIRYDMTGIAQETASTNGWIVYLDNNSDGTPDLGTSFTPVTMSAAPGYNWDPLAGFPWLFDTYVLKLWGADGADNDTCFVGTAVTGSLASGWPVDFNDLVAFIHTGGLAEGDIMCIDSTWTPPAGVWKWGSGYIPTWSGPHCYEAITPPCLVPVFDAGTPLSLTESHCDGFSYNFDATLDPLDDDASHAISFVSASLGVIDANGNWSFNPTVDQVGEHTLTVVATNDGGSGGCEASFDVTLHVTNEAPVITTCNAKNMTTGIATFPMAATDDCDQATFSWSVVSYGGTGSATINPNTGLITIDEGTANNPGETYPLVIALSDGDATVECATTVEVIAGSDYQLEIGCIGEPSGPVFQGQMVTVPVTLTAAVGPIGGYDLLIAYDNSALSFQTAEFGENYVSWEYLNYRQGANGNCSNACPTGLVRVVGIAETNNGAAHPDYFGTGVLFTMEFLVTNDRTFECSNVPLRFYWTDCGDNTLSNQTGTELFLSEAVYDGYDPDNVNGNDLLDIHDGLFGFPGYFGAHDDCTDGLKVDATRAVSFTSGCVFIACADEIDDRGDLNLNGIANEVADAVLYSRYFVYGLSVFAPATREASIAASDVNADGLALSVADLVYLIRVVIGDALPYPKIAPIATTVSVKDGAISVADDMGAAVIVVDGNVIPDLLVENMDIMYAYDAENNNTRVLVYSMQADETFSGEFINTYGNVLSVEFATYDGTPVSSKILPGSYELAQNYPNPFNPKTTIAFSVPVKSDVVIKVYNVTGQEVTAFAGSYEAGSYEIEWDATSQASGVYFYKLTAGDYEATKKMVLLK